MDLDLAGVIAHDRARRAESQIVQAPFNAPMSDAQRAESSANTRAYSGGLPRARQSQPGAGCRLRADRALACLVRAFRRGEFCSRSPDRIGVAAGPSWAGPTAPISSEAVGMAVRQRQWAAGGRQRRERRLTAAEHAARGGVRRRERVARIAPRLAKKPGRPAACLCDVCVTGTDELRACAALSNLFMD